MTVAVPRSRRVLEHEHVDDDCTPGGSPRGRKRAKWLNWRSMALTVSPLAVLDHVRDDAWALHKPGDLGRDYLTFVMAMPRHDPMRAQLQTVTDRCGDREHLAAWLRALRAHHYKKKPRDGGPIGPQTAKMVLELMLADDLVMAEEILTTTLRVAPQSGVLRMLEIWILAITRRLSPADAKFALEAIPLRGRTNHRLRNFLVRDGPSPGMNWRALATSALRRM
ncbi:MAG: hypothetical protein GY913_22680 [Proteobacteria bacterium]|nr:hypothetical protein [Pseudomonadota bacterium]MCP4919717.1 hypothetical protein [Pseudomonadota bacterium]